MLSYGPNKLAWFKSNNPVSPFPTNKVAIHLELGKIDLSFPGKAFGYREPNIKCLKNNINMVLNLLFGNINAVIFYT